MSLYHQLLLVHFVYIYYAKQKLAFSEFVFMLLAATVCAMLACVCVCVCGSRCFASPPTIHQVKWANDRENKNKLLALARINDWCRPMTSVYCLCESTCLCASACECARSCMYFVFIFKLWKERMVKARLNGVYCVDCFAKWPHTGASVNVQSEQFQKIIPATYATVLSVQTHRWVLVYLCVCVWCEPSPRASPAFY